MGKKSPLIFSSSPFSIFMLGRWEEEAYHENLRPLVLAYYTVKLMPV